MYYQTQKIGRATVQYSGSEMRVTAPSQTQWVAVVFISFWLCGWFMGEISAIGALLKGGKDAGGFFLIFWLCGWTLGGFFAMTIVAWNLFGREIVTFYPQSILIQKQVLFFKKGTDYVKDKVKDFKISSPDELMKERGGEENTKIPEIIKGFIGYGFIFDYEGKPVRCMTSLNKQSTERIFDLAKSYNFIQTKPSGW